MTAAAEGLSARERFLLSVARTGSVAVSATEVGVGEVVARSWARQAGLLTVGRVYRGHPGRARYTQLRAAGISRREAARQAGVHYRTAGDWDRGVQKINSSRTYPDGHRVTYTPQALAPFPDKPLHPRWLSVTDREHIADLLQAGHTVRAIAAELGRAPSTISREINRNRDPDKPAEPYRPYAAQRATAARRARPKTALLATDGPLRAYVHTHLQLGWSPEQINHRIGEDHPGEKDMRVSTETIYQALYLQARGGLKREVAAALRTGRTRRKPHRDPAARRSRFTDPMIMIADRPAEIADRAVPGHWEGDLIIGADNASAIGTLVERHTRYVMLLHLPAGRTAEAVRDQLVAAMNTLPAHLRGSLTWDQGSEMAAHRSFTTATDMPVYFCDPASPWQRGSNENTNGLLRQYFPKGTDLTVHGPADLEHVAHLLNGRPRKTLGWATPAERLRDLLTPA